MNTVNYQKSQYIVLYTLSQMPTFQMEGTKNVYTKNQFCSGLPTNKI